MAKDFLVFVLTYVFFFSPPKFIADNIGMAREVRVL